MFLGNESSSGLLSPCIVKVFSQPPTKATQSDLVLTEKEGTMDQPNLHEANMGTQMTLTPVFGYTSFSDIATMPVRFVGSLPITTSRRHPVVKVVHTARGIYR